MNNKITESEIETFAIELLEKEGFHYIYAPDIAPDMDVQVPRAQDAQERPPDVEAQSSDHRQSFEDVLLLDRFKSAIDRINPKIPHDAREDAFKQILRLNSPELISNNEAFHRMLTEGIRVTFQKDGNSRGDLVWLIDFDDIKNNDFVAAGQFTVTSTRSVTGVVNKRPDLIIFINGLSFVVIELKNPADWQKVGQYA